MLLAALIAAAALSGAPDAQSASAPALSATPTPKPLSKDVRTEAARAGFGALADQLARASRGAAIVRVGRPAKMPAELGTSRFGGDADLPRDEPWPSCRGLGQTFLGQVRVSDLPAEAQELRRLGGTLLLFTHVQFEEGEREYGLWAGDCSTVVHAKPGTPLRRQARPRRSTLALRSAPVSFTGRPDIPAIDSDDKLYPPLEREKVTKSERYYHFRHRLLGSPSPAHQLLGYSDEPNGGNACSERAKRSRNTWRHLFTMDWDDTLGFEVADGGILQLLIAPADLANGRFDRVCGVFESF